MLSADSINAPSARSRFETTIGFAVGVEECSALGAGAREYQAHLEAAGTDTEFVFVAGARHNVFGNPRDESYIGGPVAEFIESHCR